MHVIHHDMKVIHKIADKSGLIDFKTRVDMVVEVSKFVSLATSLQTNNQQTMHDCISAMIYTLLRLTASLD
jgi:hypothetical protein